MEFVRGEHCVLIGGGAVDEDDAGVDKRVDDGCLGREGGSKEGPCVLRSSLQCGDQWRDKTEVLRGRVSKGEGDDLVDEEELQTRIVPSGKTLPVARRSGFQGHQAKAYQEMSIGHTHKPK
jgi:hypothetical protein